jgi:hypothetical protein
MRSCGMGGPIRTEPQKLPSSPRRSTAGPGSLCIVRGQFVGVSGASLAASTNTCWICLFLCLEIGMRITLLAELFFNQIHELIAFTPLHRKSLSRTSELSTTQEQCVRGIS